MQSPETNGFLPEHDSDNVENPFEMFGNTSDDSSDVYEEDLPEIPITIKNIEPLFSSIYLKANENSDEKSIEDFVATADIGRIYTIIRNEKLPYHKYEVYRTIDILDGPPGEFCHEVIYGNRSQKLRLDVDCESGSKDTCIALESELKDIITRAITYVWGTHYNFCRPISDDNIVFISGSGMNADGKYKVSMHVLVYPDLYAVYDNHEAKYFADLVYQRMIDLDASCTHKKLYECIDMNVYKMRNNLRMLGCYKTIQSFDQPKVRQLVYDKGFKHLPYKQSLITYCEKNLHIKKLVAVDTQERFSDGNPSNTYALTDIQLRQIQELLPESDRSSFCLRDVCADTCHVIYNRTAASHCDICDKVHENDNTMYLWYVYDPKAGKVAIHKKCRHNDSNPNKAMRTKRLGFIDANQSAQIIHETFGTSPTVNQSDQAIHPNQPNQQNTYFPSRFKKPYDDNLSMFNKWAGKRYEYDDSVMHRYVEKGSVIPRTLCVRAPMKMGKSKELLRFIEENFDENAIIRIISFRRTFGQDMFSKFKKLGFELYEDIEGRINIKDHKRIIIQTESLHRLDISQPADLLIMDESESIIDQFSSNLFKSFARAFAAFDYLIKFSAHVICMDAFLQDRTFRVLQTMRGFTTHEDDMLFHVNNYKRGKDDTYLFAETKGEWLARLKSVLDDNKRVFIPTNSLSEAKALHYWITHQYTDKKVGMYSSETKNSEKVKAFKDVNTVWSEFDVLIITPTVSAGVSFERVHFDYTFGLFTSESCSVETCMQMMGRVRNVGTNEYNIFIESTLKYYPESINEIMRRLNDYNNYILSDVDESHLSFTYNRDGTINIHNKDYLRIWLENTRVKNMSKNNFCVRFKLFVEMTGATTAKLETSEREQTNACILGDSHALTKMSIKEREATAVADAEQLTVDEFLYIKALKQSTSASTPDITEEQSYAFRQYIFKKAYCIMDQPLTGAVVLNYNTDKLKKQFANLNMIVLSKTYHIDDVLTGMKQYESLKRLTAKDRVGVHYDDLLSMYDTGTPSKRGNKNRLQDNIADYLNISSAHCFVTHDVLHKIAKMVGFNGVLDFDAEISPYRLIRTLSDEQQCKEIQSMVRLLKHSDSVTFRLPVSDGNEKFEKECVKVISDLFDITYGIRVRAIKPRASDITPLIRLDKPLHFEYKADINRYVIKDYTVDEDTLKYYSDNELINIIKYRHQERMKGIERPTDTKK